MYNGRELAHDESPISEELATALAAPHEQLSAGNCGITRTFCLTGAFAARRVLGLLITLS